MRPSLFALAGRLPGLLGIDRRRVGRERRPITLHQRRIFILPTGYGVMYGLMVGTMIVTSANYNNNLGFVLAFTLASLGMIAILHTYRNMAGLTLRAGRVAPVFCGEPARFNVVIDNRRPHARSSVHVVAGTHEAAITDVAADTAVTVAVEIATARRGPLPLGTLTIYSRFPLGLFRAWSYVQLDMHCIVYPRPAPPAPPPMHSGIARGLRPRSAGGTEDFIGLRTYASGDSMRHVHWKALAREQPMMTKQFGDEESNVLWFDWVALGALEVEARLSLLCRWVLDAAAAGVPYGMRLPGQVFEPARGAAHRHRCLQALALYGRRDV